ncbi:galactosyltransferase family protein [Striga asiatica]|uniref:Galactosyltransferase family protein n=1 Tax=Striga asiatica TaxID=4170 RepID=A0A5A7NWE7_STRAF|nr:galactosyltransferase family protein [Striga asiatica]
MKRLKGGEPSSVRRFKLSYLLLGAALFYLILVFFKFPEFFESASVLSGDDSHGGLHGLSIVDEKSAEISESESDISSDGFHRILQNNEKQDGSVNPGDVISREKENHQKQESPTSQRYGRITGEILRRINSTKNLSVLDKMAEEAWVLGSKAWNDVNKYDEKDIDMNTILEGKPESCPSWVSMNGEELAKRDYIMFLPGDWSHQQVIEHNTCYRMQWGTAQRCDGLPSKSDDDMLVDGQRRCGKWMRNDVIDTKESKIFSWFERFIGRAKKPEGFTLEDATGLAIKGDVDVHSVYATSLPTSHPSFSPQRVLEFSEKWKSHSYPIPKGSVQLFIGVLSATNHFAERMAVRKTWMQSSAIKASKVVVRFFVALNPRSEVNAILKKEAAFFGDIEIIPFMDRYELVVLKTVAICEYGVRNVTAAYVMKCDDDTFIRVDTILKDIERASSGGSSLYLGNLNLLHRPLRSGKWAVTYEEWPEEIYPPYANGPGYVISSDIAKFIVSQQADRSLRLFKMEDVSMGMWVEQFNSTKNAVKYSHSWNYCQYGCMENYHTAHYQSPRQMICLWDNLMKGRPRCCNI